MANIAIFRINYKSDFILTLNSDAGWMTPFCIKFWTGAPSQAYFVGFDGTTYTHCAPVAGDPTKLVVQFDDHHLPIGDLKFQIGYHFTVADFHTSVEDEVINQAAVIIDQDGTPMQVMLDLNGETAPEIQFSLPAYANEAQRIANEEQRIANETQRIGNEETRIQHEESRIAAEQTRQQNEQQRINQEQARVNEFAVLKRESEQATTDANNAAENARQKAQLAQDKATLAQTAAQLANDKAALAQAAAQLANDKAQLAADKAALAQAASQLCDEKAALAQQKATYAQQQGDYSKAQGDYAKEQGDYSKAQGDYSKEQGDYSKEQGDYAKDKGDICAADHQTAVADHQTATADHQTAAADHQTATTDHNQAGNDHTRAESDHTRAESDHAAVEVYVDSLGVFDLSKHNAVGGVLATYADLDAALTALNALDSKYKYGGMSFKFVHSVDNKYVQYRLMSDTFNTTVANWQGVDDEPTAGSDNLVKSGGVAKYLFGPCNFLVANGSQGNSSNTWVVTLKGKDSLAIPVTPGHEYRLNINKQPETGFNFYWRICTYSTINPSSLIGNTKRNEVNNWDNYYTNGQSIKILDGELGLSIQLTELTEAGASQAADTCVPLRASNFIQGDLELLDLTTGLVYAVSNLQQDVSDVREDIALKSDESLVGAYRKSFEIAAEKGHSSNLDRVSVNIKAGTKFGVFNSSIRSGGTVNVTYKESGSSAFVGDANTVITAQDDISSIGLYLPPLTSGSAGTVTFYIYVDEALTTYLNNKDFIELNRKVYKFFNTSFIGNDNTFVDTKITGLTPNRKYRVVLKNPNYARDNVTLTGTYTFIIQNVYNDSSTRLAGTAVGYSVPNYYDITIPIDSDYIQIGGRANAGTEVEFYVYDITEILNITDRMEFITQDIHSIKQEVRISSGPLFNIQNGSQGNPKNTWVVTLRGINTLAIPVTPGHKYRLDINKTPEDGFNFYYRIGTYSSDSPSSLISNSIRKEFNNWDKYYELSDVFEIRQNEYGLSIQLTELTEPGAAQAEGTCIPLRATSFKDFDITLTDVTDSTQVKINKLEKFVNIKDSVINSYSETSSFMGQYDFKKGYTYIIVIASGNTTSNTAYICKRFGLLDTPQQFTFGIPFVANDDYFYGQCPGTLTRPFAWKILEYPDVSIFAEDLRNLEEKVGDIKDSIVDRNQDKVPMLTASCRYRKSSQTSKDFMAVIPTDSHGDSVCVANSVNALNGFDRIDVLIHCGDCVSDTFSIGEDVSAIWKDIVANADKPFYFVLGNHEVGNYYGIGYVPSKTELYNSFIKPIVDSGHLNVGEYEVGRCYYYHDFASDKIRLIVLDEYEAPKILDETYWEAVEYNSSYDNIIVNNHAYSTGDFVNVPGYTDYSFKAKSDFTTAYYNKTVPSYKYRIGYRWISQTQAQWFLDTIASTPQNYFIIVACHNPYSNHADVVQSAKFSQNNNWIDGYGIQSYMVTDFIADAINAFQTKQNFSTTCESLYPTDMPSYHASKDFSQVEGKFHSLIGGHVHEDCVWKHQTYNQYQITPIDTNSKSYVQSTNADIRRSNSSDTNSIDTDCLTVVSFGENRLGLVKLGVNVTDTGEKRDFEVIDIS